MSNHEFYDNRLVVFPSPDAGKVDAGLLFRHDPDADYQRRGINTAEAKTIAQAVMKHARETPELTLGVAAFSNVQARRIEDEVDILCRRDPSHEEFFAAHPEEPFFVKNLENVQGDERDVILISIGYGKVDGAYLPMNFGPLNRDGGERRLNVAHHPGPPALHRVLQLRWLGSAGFFVDLAVVDPERPGRYLLGIECDGATYHSSRSARDRDRLRQQVLEGLGWRIHRIWSTDWFRNPHQELERVGMAVRAAKMGGAPRAAPKPSPPKPLERAPEPEPEIPPPTASSPPTRSPKRGANSVSSKVGARSSDASSKYWTTSWRRARSCAKGLCCECRTTPRAGPSACLGE